LMCRSHILLCIRTIRFYFWVSEGMDFLTHSAIGDLYVSICLLAIQVVIFWVVTLCSVELKVVTSVLVEPAAS
jgi:hypothetical protein